MSHNFSPYYITYFDIIRISRPVCALASVSVPFHGSRASIYRSLIVVEAFGSFATFGQSQYRSTVTWTRNFSSFGLDFAEATSEFNIARARLATRKCHGSVNGFAVEIIADFRLVRAINGRWKLLCKKTMLSFAFLKEILLKDDVAIYTFYCIE